MKTSVFKLILPAFAILLAVGLAFATENTKVAQQAHYYLPGQGWQSTMVEDECFDGGSISCKYNGNQLYSEPDFTSVQLSKP